MPRFALAPAGSGSRFRDGDEGRTNSKNQQRTHPYAQVRQRMLRMKRGRSRGLL